MKDRRSMSDWWTQHLSSFADDGRKDAERGVYEPPWLSEDDDPQNQDENLAYRKGFDKRRKELGNAFKWA